MLPARARSGLSLIEVLASIGVITVGLLGLAALLPAGLVTIYQATKADRAGNCGRAAVRDVVVRRMLDPNNWVGPPGSGSFLIDPLRVTSGTNTNFGNNATAVPRISLGTRDTSGNLLPYTFALADAIFCATDDITVAFPEDMKPPQPVGRPLNLDGNGKPIPLASQGYYSWFVTVTPAPNVPTRFTVSVVVCYKRNLDPAAEQAVAVSQFFDGSGGVALGGGSIQLKGQVGSDKIQLRENSWVALCNGSGLCRWYRVVAIGDDTSQLTLSGPDWPYSADASGQATSGDTLVALGQEVVGVYTTTIDLDTDPTWTN